MLNKVCLQGRLTADPELRHTANNVPVCSFRIAVERGYARQGEERQADFISVVAWRNTAEFVCRYFTKGKLILVDGSIQTRRYEDKQGGVHTAVEVLSDGVNFCGPSQEGASKQQALPQDRFAENDFEDLPF